MDQGPAGEAVRPQGQGVVGPTPVADEVAVGLPPRAQEADPGGVQPPHHALPRTQGGLRLRFAGPPLLHGPLRVRLQGHFPRFNLSRFSKLK